MNFRKVLILFSILVIHSFCFSQTKGNILGFSLGESKESVRKKLADEQYIHKQSDNSKEIFPITLELYSKSDLKFNKIPVEHITFSYCYDKLFCVSIVTSPIDDLELLTNSRKSLKREYNLEKKNFIQIDEEFYDKKSNPSFYICNDNQEFILIIYGKENFNGKIPQCYNFMYKSKADEAIQLKNSYQSYSNINGYTELSLDELKQKALVMQQEEDEKNRQLEAQKLERERQNRIDKEKRQKEYEKKHRFDKYMGGFTAGYFGGGFYSGTNEGGFGTLDFSYNIIGPFSLGLDWRVGSIKPTAEDKEYGGLRMDIDAYLALGFSIPIKNHHSPIIYAAVAPGCFLYQEKDTSYRYSDKYEAKTDTFIDFRGGLIVPLSYDWDFKFVYSKEMSKNNGEMNIFTFLIGGRFL